MYAHFNHVTHILRKKWTHLCIKLHCMSKFDCLLHRVLPATAESIGHLTALKGTPLAYLLTPRLPVEHTAVGPVQAGSPLPYHVCMTLTDLASTASQTFFKMLSWKFVSKLRTNQISLMIGNSLIGILWLTNDMNYMCCNQISIRYIRGRHLCSWRGKWWYVKSKSQVFQLFVYSETFVTHYCITCYEVPLSSTQGATDHRLEVSECLSVFGGKPQGFHLEQGSWTELWMRRKLNLCMTETRSLFLSFWYYLSY